MSHKYQDTNKWRKKKCESCGQLCYGILCRNCKKKTTEYKTQMAKARLHKTGKVKPNNPTYHSIPRNKDGTINDIKLDALCEELGKEN